MRCKLSSSDASAFIFIHISEEPVFEEKAFADIWLCHDPQTAEFTKSGFIWVVSAINPHLLIEVRYAIIIMVPMAKVAQHSCYIFQYWTIIIMINSMLSEEFSQFIDLEDW